MCSWRHPISARAAKKGEETTCSLKTEKEGRAGPLPLVVVGKLKPSHYDLLRMVVHNDQVLSTALALIYLPSIDFQETFKNLIMLETSTLFPIQPSKFQSFPLGREGKSDLHFKQLRKSVPIGNKTKNNKIHTYKWSCS